MKYLFKSNIKCGGCIATVTPVLDAESGIKAWEVDLEHPDRILTVETEVLSPDQIQAIVAKAGFETEELTSI